MKTIKIIGITILIIIAIPFIVALFIPKSYTVSVSETIDKPQQEVYDYVRILDNQKYYSVWVLQDPDLNPEIIGTDGTVGAIQRWDSKVKDVGAGEQEITSLAPDRMDIDLRFIRPFEGNAKVVNLLKALSENTTELTIEFSTTDKYPMNLPSYLFGRKLIRESTKENLLNIKQILEDH